MNAKFTFRMFQRQMLEFDKERFTKLKSGLADGDYELIVRPKPCWDTTQLNRYFHGPVIKHFMNGYRELGSNISKPDMKFELKRNYGSWKNVSLGGDKVMPVIKSTSEYTTEEWKELLKGCNMLSIDHLQCELPVAEEVDSQ